MKSLLFTLGLVALYCPFAADAATQLKVGGLSVIASMFENGGCVQLPILLNEPIRNNLDLRELTYTLAISDPNGVIAGGVSAEMVVANGFAPVGAGTGQVGLTNPGSNLANSNGVGTPNCSGRIVNRVTQGQGPAINFGANSNNFAGWSINNNFGGVGRKRAFLIDQVNNGSLALLPKNTDLLVGVLEIPIVSNPGVATLSISVANGVGFNEVTYGNGGIQTTENLAASVPASVVLTPPPAIQLKLGSLELTSANLAAGGCVQVPILLNDPGLDNRDVRDLTFTLQLTDPSNIISGGIATNVVVANGFAATGAGTGTVGLSNPATNLANSNGAASPDCTGFIANQATQGQGHSLSFAASTNAFANWSINNNFAGLSRKRAFLIDPVTNLSVVQMPMNTDILLAVMEIPIVALPGNAVIGISAVSGIGNNSYTYAVGGIQTEQDFNLSQTIGQIRLDGALLQRDGFE